MLIKMDETNTKRQVPFSLQIVGAEVAGVIYELFPRLLERFSDEELVEIGENAMTCVGDRYMMPLCGSALWTVYKRICDRDLDRFAEALKKENMAETRERINKELQ